mmetsp:Transcript_6103/g.10509  ORF Transcript_6103/g.10509 Transcript_6103/m.10509 type:complete len:213 (-) Transcript_6103:760-1398(-)
MQRYWLRPNSKRRRIAAREPATLPLQPPDLQLGQTVCIAACNLEAEAVEGKTLAGQRDRLRLMNDEASDGIGLLIGQRPIRRTVQVADGHRPVDGKITRRIGPQYRRVGGVELVGDFTDDLFEDIFQRDQPAKRAIFIHDQREVRMAAQELAHLIVERRGFRHKIGFHGDGGDVETVEPRRVLAPRQTVDRAQKVLGMNDADDVFGIVAEHG